MRVPSPPGSIEKRLKAAWEIRQKQWPGLKKASLSTLAIALSKRNPTLKIDENDPKKVEGLANRVSQYFKDGAGRSALEQPLLEFLEPSEAFLENSKITQLPTWTSVYVNGKVTSEGGQPPTQQVARIIAGGGVGVFDIEEDQAGPTPGPTNGDKERIYLEVCDASLMPAVKPGEVIVFKRINYVRVEKTLLVRNRADNKKHSVRVYSPATEDADECFIDPRPGSRHAPLKADEWEVVGMALGKLTEEGILL